MSDSLRIVLEFLNTNGPTSALVIRAHFEADARKKGGWSSLFIPGLVARGFVTVKDGVYSITEAGAGNLTLGAGLVA